MIQRESNDRGLLSATKQLLMSNQRHPEQEAFDRLLAWLDPDRERAGRKYEEIRRILLKFFAWNGGVDAEQLVDETITRVTQKVETLLPNYEGDPALYFRGVAKYVMKEYIRQEHPLPLSEAVSSGDEAEGEHDGAERMHECLEICLRELSNEDRELVLSYYEESKQAKIHFRKMLAERMKVAPTALRVRMHRIRAKLHECIERCLAGEVAR